MFSTSSSKRPLAFTVVSTCCAWAMLAAVCISHAFARESEESSPQDGPRFDVLEFVVEGNSVLAPAAIERAVYRFLGPGRQFKDVESARAALEAAYRDAGYATVSVLIPEQKVAGGEIRLEVVEGRVDRLRVVGSKYFAAGEIRSRTPSLAPGAVPYFPDVQQELAELNQSPNRQVQPLLRPGRGPGTVEVELKVDDRLPLHGSADFNNNASPNTADTRLALQLRYDNLFQRDHGLGINYVFSPEEPSETRVYSASYVAPFVSHGFYLAAYAVRSDSNVAAVGDVNVIGKGNIYGLRVIRPLRLGSAPGFYHSVTFGLDYKDFDDQTRLIGGEQSIVTPVTYAPFIAQYSATWTSEPVTSTLVASVTAAPRGFAGASEQDFENRRFGASSSFMYFRGSARRAQTFDGGWKLVTNADGQWSGVPLIANEQFFIGGQDSVRGYKLGDVLGDYGVSGQAEVRTPNLLKSEGAFAEAFALVFADGGWVAIRDPLPSQQDSATISSAGLGLRARARRYFSAALDVAWPFHNTLYTEKGRAKFVFRLIGEF